MTAELLQSSPVRLFVGNLVPSITDIALLRLFSRFGEPSELERNTEEGFAHLSIEPRGTDGANDVERCLSSLNRTTWYGTTLRVERAREHFLTRLKREWAEERDQVCDSAQNADDVPAGDHFRTLKKGKHTRFSFPDLEPSKSCLENQMEDQPESESGKSTKLHSRSPMQNESDADLSRAVMPVNPSSSKTVKLDSTLALFGLSSTSAEVRPQVNESVIDKKRHQPPRERSLAKRPRSPTRTEPNADQGNQIPSLFDIGSEKQTASMVLQKLFPEAQVVSSTTSCRRLGLYRKLLQAPVQTPDGEVSQENVRARRELGACVHVTEPSRISEDADRGSLNVSFRRAGLYRMLEKQASSS